MTEQETSSLGSSKLDNQDARQQKQQQPQQENGSNGSNLLSLGRRYLYQNPTTGAVSSMALTVKQLCRMFSPPISSADQPAPTLPSRFNADTQLLALQDDGQYDPAGWKPAKEIPIIKHATCPAFYYCQVNDETPNGPISCRQLALQMLETKELDPLRDRVTGVSTNNQWVLVDSVPDLKVSLEAFCDQAGPDPAYNAHKETIQSTGLQNYDISQMIYEDNVENPGADPTTKDNIAENEEEVQDELEAFLSSTDHLGRKVYGAIGNSGDNYDDGDDSEGYESDGGTKYVKDPRTGNWIHQALAPPKPTKKSDISQPPSKKQKTLVTDNNNNLNYPNKKKKTKKPKFAAKNAKCWIYVTGLPPDTDEEEVGKFFSKVGIIDLDPETQKPKAKVYRHQTDTTDDAGLTIKAGTCKGDASIGYARPESVELAMQVLDEAPFRESAIGKNHNPYRVRVERAKFEQHGDYTQQKDKKKRISQAQRKVAKLAAKQAIDWDDGEFNGRLTGGLKGLRIIVLKGTFHPTELAAGGDEEEEDRLLAELEQNVRKICEEFGVVEKITVFSQNPQGVMVIKFAQPGAASEAVKAWNGRIFQFGQRQRKVESSFWDGVTDFTVRDEERERKEMEERHDEFGAWIESHTTEELPDELRLKVETDKN